MLTVKNERLNPREHKGSIIAVCLDGSAKAWHRGLALQLSMLAPNIVKDERIEAKLGCIPDVGKACCRADGQGRIIGCLYSTNEEELRSSLKHFIRMIAHPKFAPEGVTILSDSLGGHVEVLQEVLADCKERINEWVIYSSNG